ncbi:MAG: NAD-dependent epimerase/dehydratase family protein [Pseudomonadota bacterium]
MTQPIVGLVEWFRPGEHERVERVLADLRSLGVKDLRVGVSWADWFSADGEAWYRWLLPRLAQEVRILPCFLDALPFLNVVTRLTRPPHEPEAYADWIELFIARHGQNFEWLELWIDPFLRQPDAALDAGEQVCFGEMLSDAARRARKQGKRIVLGGLSPRYPKWLQMLAGHGLLAHVDALGLHAFPGTYDFQWEGWPDAVDRLRGMLAGPGAQPEIWVSETGYATVRHDERQQLREFLAALDAPVTRVYWYGLEDRPAPAEAGDYQDERAAHFGLRQGDGAPKLLFRLWATGGLDGVREAAWMTRQWRASRERMALITGGAGFIGTNLAHRLLGMGRPVLILDNLARPGVERNLQWLRDAHGERARFQLADVRDAGAVREAVTRAEQVYHLAAQVAVTTSLVNPLHDFQVNALGTINLLEAVRAQDAPPPVLVTSTNKVYGALEQVGLRLHGKRYEPEQDLLRGRGIGEDAPLDFHSPYGCSKGAADQYVLDYARSFGLATAVFRMSCIYGPHQFGTEDQGWVAHFLIRAIEDQPITLYGDGMQVRDVLFVEDLVDALLLAMERMDALSGQAFNMGGGPANSVSLLELIELIAELHGGTPGYRFGPWRVGDQRYYVSDTRKFQAATGWQPRVDVRTGVRRLYEWLLASRGLAPRRPKTAEAMR